MKTWSLIVICSLWLGTSAANAAGDFYTIYDVTYDVDQNGIASVTEIISLKNLVSRVYSTQYQVVIPGKPTDIQGTDSRGPLKISSQEVPVGTQITALFNDQATGIGQYLHFTLSYKLPVADKKGEIWELVIPKLGNPNSVDAYNLRIAVPISFGQPASIFPPPDSANHPQYFFSKSQLTQSAITAQFGNFQSYSFQLKYRLQNSSRKAQKMFIPLPPDTHYQKIFIDDVSPMPLDVSSDADGNWLASYRLKPRQNLEIITSGRAQVYSQPVKFGGNTSDTSRYLVADTYWPVDDPLIQSIAQNLKAPSDIYGFVVNRLSYNPVRLSNPTRRGALSALADPTHSLCTDFTDLFITLSRAAGIPAREVQGHAVSTNNATQPLSLITDVLHSWPQYFDSDRQVWIDVDPTWGQTSSGQDYFGKLDFNHLAFVIHGLSSTRPLSPGFYKQDNSTKDVQVQPISHIFPIDRAPQVTWKLPWQIFPFISTAHIRLYNPGPTAIYNYSKSPFLPFSTHSTPVKITGHLFPIFTPHVLTAQIGSNEISYNVPVSKYLLWYAAITITISTVVIALVWLAHRSWSLSSQKRLR